MTHASYQILPGIKEKNQSRTRYRSLGYSQGGISQLDELALVSAR